MGCADAKDDSGVNIGPLGAMPAGSSLLQEHCVGEGVVSSDMGWGLPNFAGALAGMGSCFLLALGLHHRRALPFPSCRPNNTPKRGSQPLVGIPLEPGSRMWPCSLMGSLGLTLVKLYIQGWIMFPALCPAVLEGEKTGSGARSLAPENRV